MNKIRLVAISLIVATLLNNCSSTIDEEYAKSLKNAAASGRINQSQSNAATLDN